MRPIGEYLSSDDAYFNYAGSTYGEGAETRPPEGTVMSYSESIGGITSRIDVVPRDPEAMELYGPKGTMRLPADAYQKAQEAMATGKDFTFEGVEYEWERLPPAFSEEIGRTGRADVTLGPAPRRRATRWDARLTVDNGGTREQLDVVLEAVDVPPGWDGRLEGEVAGLKVRHMMRRVGEGEQGELSYNYSLSDAPARQQLAALRLLNLAAIPGGRMRIANRVPGPMRETTFDTGAMEKTERLDALSAFLGWIVEIETWTGRTLPVRPSVFTEENFGAVAEIAAAVRRGGFEVKVEGMEFLADPDADPISRKEAGPIVIRRDLSVRLLGEEIALGPSQIILEGYRIEEVGLDPQGRRRRRLRAEDPAAAPTSFERIASPKKSKKASPATKKARRQAWAKPPPWRTLIDHRSLRYLLIGIGGGAPRGSHSRAKNWTGVERSPRRWLWNGEKEAADGGRTRDLKLGKLALYQLSYRRTGWRF